MDASKSTTKSCSNPNCTEVNPQPLANFHKDSHKKDGYRSRCKTCLCAEKRERRQLDAEAARAKDRAYYYANREKQQATARRWKANNRERTRQLWQDWYDRNVEERREYHRQYAKDNAEAMRHKSRTRRARLLAAEGSFTEAEFQAKLEASGLRCFYCDAALTKETATRDHVIPLTQGGRNDIDNIVPACLSCNCQKRTKDARKFKARKIPRNRQPRSKPQRA